MDSTDIFNDLYKAEESPQPSDKEGECINLINKSNSAQEWIYTIMFLGFFFFADYESKIDDLYEIIDWLMQSLIEK